MESTKVTIGHGMVVDCLEKCQFIVILVQEVSAIENYSLPDLGDTDVILGYSWVTKLGEMWVNWKENTISFTMTLVGSQ